MHSGHLYKKYHEKYKYLSEQDRTFVLHFLASRINQHFPYILISLMHQVAFWTQLFNFYFLESFIVNNNNHSYTRLRKSKYMEYQVCKSSLWCTYISYVSLPVKIIKYVLYSVFTSQYIILWNTVPTNILFLYRVATLEL